ncbi:MAG TPA: beta-ketoacyl-ACP synthase III, partial [Kofleriaceae bacterium]|nr:beta-ketoacyl-ACP synthase III [Kofleriaceae bacterium]
MKTTTGMAITGSGVYHPPGVITNDELCEAFNEFVRRDNQRNAAAIAAGERNPLHESSGEFIRKASGIRQRYVEDRSGLLDPDRMCPNIPDRPDDALAIQAEYAVKAAQPALAAAGRVGEDVDMILLAASSLQRQYPAMAMEVQGTLGARGFAYDLSVGCSSATFPVQIACDALRAGNAECALLVNPELTTGHMNWRDRDSHFIFGDAATALVIEPVERARKGAFEILGTRLWSRFSNAIRNNHGYLNRCDPSTQFAPDKLFYQQGRKVFKDIVPVASQFILDHLASLGLEPGQVTRYWLHQANAKLNELVAKRVLGREPTREEAPLILDEYANTASAGSIIAFHHHHADLKPGAIGVLCSFGAG